MTATEDLIRTKKAYFGGRLDEARGHLEKAEGEVIGKKRFGRKRRTKRFAGLLQAHDLTRVVQILKDYASNTAWIKEEKRLYAPVVNDAVGKEVARLEAEFRRDSPALIPRWRWIREAFWQQKRQAWRDQVMAAMETKAERELDVRVSEMANLQVRLTLILTLTTAMLAIMSLGNKIDLSPVMLTVAAVVGCVVLGIALEPMKSKYRQAWRNKFVDPVVWATLAADPLGRLCLLRGATSGRNTVITRYKRVLWALVPSIRLILVALVVVSAQALPLFQ